jgi:GNAT superfamily N-acetyltransferase
MNGVIRAARPDDVSAMVDLSEQKRIQYEPYNPTFHRKAPDSWEKQTPFFESLLTRERIIALVHEQDGRIDGFVIAALVDAPPVYDPGGLTCLIDDFMLARPDDWATIGLALLREANARAKPRGAVQTVVVCGPQDEPKRAMLAAAGFDVVTEWRVANL